ncbi:hypothetical protein [Arthrobacter sp. D2-10]
MFSQTAAMGKFHADMASSVPLGRSVQDVEPEIRQVLDRHGVTVEWTGVRE